MNRYLENALICAYTDCLLNKVNNSPVCPYQTKKIIHLSALGYIGVRIYFCIFVSKISGPEGGREAERKFFLFCLFSWLFLWGRGGGGNQWEFEKQFATLSNKSLKSISRRSLTFKSCVKEHKNKHRLFSKLEGEIAFPKGIRLLRTLHQLQPRQRYPTL